ncbi:MAG: class I SAM-dependent methyltransferase, partial [Ornithinimicrobium sp.]
ILKYIFPGGVLPSLRAINEVLAEHTRLEVSSDLSFGTHYAETLKRWRARFDANWDDIATHGFDERFRRMWEFYLGYCEAGFRVEYIGVHQLQMTRRPT